MRPFSYVLGLALLAVAGAPLDPSSRQQQCTGVLARRSGLRAHDTAAPPRESERDPSGMGVPAGSDQGDARENHQSSLGRQLAHLRTLLLRGLSAAARSAADARPWPVIVATVPGPVAASRRPLAGGMAAAPEGHRRGNRSKRTPAFLAANQAADEHGKAHCSGIFRNAAACSQHAGALNYDTLTRLFYPPALLFGRAPGSFTVGGLRVRRR